MYSLCNLTSFWQQGWQVERHFFTLFCKQRHQQNRKKSPTGYFGPGIIIFLCNEAVLLSSEKHFVPWRLSQTGLYRYSHFKRSQRRRLRWKRRKNLKKLPVISSLTKKKRKRSNENLLLIFLQSFWYSLKLFDY